MTDPDGTVPQGAESPAPLDAALSDLLTELVHGAPNDAMAFILNSGDDGLLRSLDRLSSAEASRPLHAESGSVAAHVEHLRYGLSLLNRWSAGEDPFSTADYSAAWRRGQVDEAGWAEIRRELRREAEEWRSALRIARDLSPVELRGVISSIAHLAYHFGAIRQISPGSRGPHARD